MDENTALQYREFYMQCLAPSWDYPHKKTLEDFRASGLPYPNDYAISTKVLMAEFTGTAFGQLSPGKRKTARWCAENLWHAKRCPFPVMYFEDYYWSGDPDLPRLP